MPSCLQHRNHDQEAVRLDGFEPEDLIPAAKQLLPLLAAISIELSGLAIFPGAEPVLWLAPAPSVSLLQAHRRLCSDLAPMVVHDHYRPDLWMPHVTLAARLDQRAAVAAVFELVPAMGPTSGKVAALEVVSFPPARVVWRGPVADQQKIASGHGHQALALPCQ